VTPQFAPRLLCATLLSAACAGAHAHTPYLLPNIFQTSERTPVISVDASLTDTLFIPDIAYGKHPFSLTGPDGKTVSIPQADIHQLATRTVVEHRLTDAKGTFRITAGPRVGTPFRTWEIDGKTERVRDPKVPMPAGAVLKSHSQSISVAEAYITIGDKPDNGALKARGKGLEIVPATHPGALFAGDKFAFAVHYDGKPLAGHAVKVIYSNMDFSGSSTAQEVKTDAQGRVDYALANPGVYMAQVSYSDNTPPDPEKPARRYSNTLTFHVSAQP